MDSYGYFLYIWKSVGLALALKLFIIGGIYVAFYHAARISLEPERRQDTALVGRSPLLIFSSPDILSSTIAIVLLPELCAVNRAMFSGMDRSGKWGTQY